MDARREQLRLWKLRREQERVQGQKGKVLNKRRNRHFASSTRTALATSTNKAPHGKNITKYSDGIRQGKSTNISSNSSVANNRKPKRMDMDKENTLGDANSRRTGWVARRRKFPHPTNNDFDSPSTLYSGKLDQNDTQSSFSSSEDTIKAPCTKNAETQTEIGHRQVQASCREYAVQTIHQFSHLDRCMVHKGTDTVNEHCHVGTSTVDDGEMNESAHYKDMLAKMNEKKMELKEKDSIISRLKFAQEVTLQQMCELQDDILASDERENNLKLQLEALKTQLVMNLQVAVEKNKELKAENEDLRRQLGCKSPTT